MKDLITPVLHESGVISREYPILESFGVSWVGFTTVRGPAVRVSNQFDKRFVHVQTTVSGECEVLLKGVWMPLPENTAYVMPLDADWAWRHKASQPVWKVIFVRFAADTDIAGATGRSDPFILSDVFPHDLAAAYQLLYRESITAGRATAMRCLAELVAFHARGLLSRMQPTNQLAGLWMKVAADLARPWNLPLLCAAAHMSPEKLRLLCRRETGVSPMRFVTGLRMRQAAALLRETSQTIAEISRRVGYEDPFNFSTSFKRCHGKSPREFRKEFLAES